MTGVDFYYDAFPEDRISLKVSVMVLDGVSMTQTVLVFVDMYASVMRSTCEGTGTGQNSWFTMYVSSATCKHFLESFKMSKILPAVFLLIGRCNGCSATLCLQDLHDLSEEVALRLGSDHQCTYNKDHHEATGIS
jgi:hypothetical protein